MLDGRDGKPLIDPPLRDTVGAQASALTVSMEGRGNDVFLYWAADCQDHSGEGGEYHFIEGMYAKLDAMYLGWLAGLTNGRMDGWMDIRTDGWMDGRTDGRTHESAVMGCTHKYAP